MMEDANDRYSGGYYGEAGTRNPEEPASAAYLPAHVCQDRAYGPCPRPECATHDVNGMPVSDEPVSIPIVYGASGPAYAVDLLKKDLINLLRYNWRDEEADYYRALVEEDNKQGVSETHIFPVMQRLNDWINQL